MIDWLRREAIEPEIELGDRTLPIDLIRNRRAKRLTLRLAPDGSAVRITLPHWCRSVEAIGFVHARRDWLTEQLAKIPPKRDPVAERRLMYRGTHIALDWRADAPRRPDLDDDTLTIGGPQDTLTRRLQR